MQTLIDSELLCFDDLEGTLVGFNANRDYIRDIHHNCTHMSDI